MEIKFLKECGCVKRLGLNSNNVFNSKEESLKKLDKIMNVLKKESCQTHKFSHREIGDKIFIDAILNTDKI